MVVIMTNTEETTIPDSTDTFSSIPVEIEIYNKAQETYQKALDDVKEKHVKKAFKVFLEAHPEIKCIFWSQYTPYFNDGDPCTFSVHEPSVIVDPKLLVAPGKDRDYYTETFKNTVKELEEMKLEKKSGKAIIDYIQSESKEYNFEYVSNFMPEKLKKEFHEFFWNTLGEELLKKAFDDGFTVFVTKTSIQTCEKNHD